MRKLFLIVFLHVFSLYVFAQDINYARDIIEKLCAADMYGRGYVNAGDKKDAYLIENEFNRFNLQPYD